MATGRGIVSVARPDPFLMMDLSVLPAASPRRDVASWSQTPLPLACDSPSRSSPRREGGFVAQCIEVPGAQGETEEEALENIQEAVLLVLDARRDEARQRQAHLRTVDAEAST